MTLALTDNELRKQLAVRMKQDFPGYCKRCLRIKTKEGSVEPFSLYYTQLRVYKEIVKLSQAGKPVRIIILKARQQGMSTFSQAWLAHKAFTGKGQNCLTIAQNLDMAGELFGKIEMMYSLLPEWAKPEKDSRTRGKRLALAAPNHSLLYVDTAENRDAGRSGTFQHVHATEIPLWPDAKRTMDGLLQSVPNKPGTSVIVESTAKGMGDYFHQMWSLSCEGETGFTPVFIPWFDHPEYEREPIEGETVPDWVKEVEDKFKLPRSRTVWYFDKYKDLGLDRDILGQEYPSDATDAFISSGRRFFNRESLEHYRKIVEDESNVPKREGMYYQRNGKPHWFDQPDGEIRVWELPKPGAYYVLGADIATGRAFDKSSIQVLRGLRQVCSYSGRAEPDQLADLISWLGRFYNGAMVVPERNGVGLATVLRLVNELQYPHIYTDKRLDTTTGNENVQYGWTTTPSNRPAMLEELAVAVRTGELGLKCSRTLKEMETFVFTDDMGKRAEANPGSNDDMVMALAIAVRVSNYMGGGEIIVEREFEDF